MSGVERREVVARKARERIRGQTSVSSTALLVGMVLSVSALLLTVVILTSERGGTANATLAADKPIPRGISCYQLANGKSSPGCEDLIRALAKACPEKNMDIALCARAVTSVFQRVPREFRAKIVKKMFGASPALRGDLRPVPRRSAETVASKGRERPVQVQRLFVPAGKSKPSPGKRAPTERPGGPVGGPGTPADTPGRGATPATPAVPNPGSGPATPAEPAEPPRPVPRPLPQPVISIPVPAAPVIPSVKPPAVPGPPPEIPNPRVPPARTPPGLVHQPDLPPGQSKVKPPHGAEN